MKKLLIIAASVAATFSVSASDLYSVEAAEEIKGYSQDQLAAVTTKLNAKFAKDMPVKVDEVTTITAMYYMSTNRSINYRAEVDLSKYDVTVEFSKKALEENKHSLFDNLCHIYSTRTLMEAGFVVNYRYVSLKNEYITSLKITKEDCK